MYGNVNSKQSKAKQKQSKVVIGEAKVCLIKLYVCFIVVFRQMLIHFYLSDLEVVETMYITGMGKMRVASCETASGYFAS